MSIKKWKFVVEFCGGTWAWIPEWCDDGYLKGFFIWHWYIGFLLKQFHPTNRKTPRADIPHGGCFILYRMVFYRFTIANSLR